MDDFDIWECNSILIPVGGGNSWAQAAKKGVSLAHQLDAEVHFLFVVDSVLTNSADYTADPESIKSDLQQQARDILDQYAEHAREEGLVVHEVVREGSPAEEIVRYTEENEIDLIALATEGSRRFRDVLLGSVTQSVLDQSPVPVLTMRLS